MTSILARLHEAFRVVGAIVIAKGGVSLEHGLFDVATDGGAPSTDGRKC